MLLATLANMSNMFTLDISPHQVDESIDCAFGSKYDGASSLFNDDNGRMITET